MRNTAKTTGKNDIKTFVKAITDHNVTFLLGLLNIQDAKSHEEAVDLVGRLMDEIGDDPSHPANTFMDLLTDAIGRYEDQIYGPPKKVSSLEMMKYFMELHDLKQADLADIFGSQGNVSQVLKGEREINLTHIRKLAERFKVDPAVFV